MKTTKIKDWLIFEKDNELYAIEDTHKNKIPGIKGGRLVGFCAFEHPKDAIDYMKVIITVNRLR